jgi:formate-dependent nitrite reductase membrane component NrfD
VDFGTLSGLVALAQLADDVTGWPAARRLARLAGLPAAGLGAVLATYTGVLVSATSVPLWATVPRQLPALFGATAMATATAAISLILDLAEADVRPRRRLDRLALITGIAQFAISKQMERQWRQAGVNGPLEQAPRGAVRRGLVMGAGMLAPLAVRVAQGVTGRRLRWAGLVASLATLAGGYGERWLVVYAGRDSADRPRDYFAITQSPEGADAFAMRAPSANGAISGVSR